MRITPFRGLRYDRRIAGPDAQTSAPAYDELDPLSYTTHSTTNPYTVLELIAGNDAAAADPYASARATLERWRRTGILVTEPRPALYLYEQHELRHGRPAVQRGIIGAVDLVDLDRGELLLHEHIDPARAEQRAQRLGAVPLDLTPAIAIHPDGAGPDLSTLVTIGATSTLLSAFTDEADIDHRLWRIDDAGTLRQLQAGYRSVTAVLADGHHRVEAARQQRDRAADRDEAGPGWTRTMICLVNATTDGPELRAVHRLIPALPPMTRDGTPDLPGFRVLLWRGGAVDLERSLADAAGLTYGLITTTGLWLLRAEHPGALRTAAADGVPLLGELDAQVAAFAILPHFATDRFDAVFGVDSVDTQKLTGAHMGEEDAQSLLLLRPPAADQVMRIAAAGHRMPPKTTWFRPKPRAGLLMRHLDDDPMG